MKKMQFSSAIIATSAGCAVWALGWWLSMTSNWGWVIGNVGSKTYGDLRIITSTAGCIRDPKALDFFGESCSAWAASPGSFPSMPYNYPKLWAVLLAQLGIVESATDTIGLLFISLYASAIVLLIFIAIRGQKHRVTLSAIILLGSLTPGALLGLQRGNFDLLVFFVLVLAIFFSASRHYWLASTFLSIAAILKIFPIGALISLYARPDKKIKYLLTSLLLAGTGFVFYLRDFPVIGKRTPLDDSASFGVSVLPLRAAKMFEIENFNPEDSRYIGWLIFLVVLSAYLLLLGKRRKNNSFRQSFNGFTSALAGDEITRTLFLVGFGATGTTYLLGTNYEYRAIFLLPVLAAFARGIERFDGFSIFLTTVLISILLLTDRLDAYQYLGDILLAFLMPFLAIVTLEVTRKARSL